MPRSLILRTVSLGLLYLIILFSVYVLLLGHNNPGGGFIAGLITGAVILIQYLAWSREDLERTFYPIFHRLIGAGLIVAGGSGLFGVLLGSAFLQGFHWEWTLPGGSHFAIPSVVFFDLGVYFVVVGMVISVFLALEEKRE